MNLLIVENNLILTKIWNSYFGQKYDVKYANTVGDAINMINKEVPKVAILDLRLNGPEASGLTVYNHIRETCNSNIPILFITGLEESTDLHKEAKLKEEVDTKKGVITTVLKKPIKFRDLSPIIDKAVAA